MKKLFCICILICLLLTSCGGGQGNLNVYTTSPNEIQVPSENIDDSALTSTDTDTFETRGEIPEELRVYVPNYTYTPSDDSADKVTQRTMNSFSVSGDWLYYVKKESTPRKYNRLMRLNLKTGEISSPCLDPVCTHDTNSCPFQYGYIGNVRAYGRYVVFAGGSGATSADHIHIYDTETGSITVIDENIPSFTDFLASCGNIYYVKDGALICFNTDTCEKKTLFCEKSIGSPHISADGRFISLFSCSPEISRFFRVDTESGVGELLFETTFGEPHPYANHGMISPKDENKIFFSHEGNTRYITNRLWLYDDSKKLDFNIARQRLGKNGELIDCYGHECWSHDGKGLYFVKYRESEAPRGICYVDIETGEQRLLFSGYDYWHVSASYSERYIAADTRNLGGNKSGVVLIDLKNGEEKMIDTVSTTFKHPCHPHPQISPNQRKIIYHFSNDRKKCCVRVANLL